MLIAVERLERKRPDRALVADADWQLERRDRIQRQGVVVRVTLRHAVHVRVIVDGANLRDEGGELGIAAGPRPALSSRPGGAEHPATTRAPASPAIIHFTKQDYTRLPRSRRRSPA